MTKKFERAKAETTWKCNEVLEAIRAAQRAELGRCGFCCVYGYNCEECPVNDLCGGELHRDVIHALADLEAKVVEGLSLLAKVEEKQLRGGASNKSERSTETE